MENTKSAEPPQAGPDHVHTELVHRAARLVRTDPTVIYEHVNATALRQAGRDRLLNAM